MATPKIGFYIRDEEIVEVVSITKTGMLNLRTWRNNRVDETGRRKMGTDGSINLPLERGYPDFRYKYFYFDRATYLGVGSTKALNSIEDLYQVEGERILI